MLDGSGEAAANIEAGVVGVNNKNGEYAFEILTIIAMIGTPAPSATFADCLVSDEMLSNIWTGAG